MFLSTGSQQPRQSLFRLRRYGRAPSWKGWLPLQKNHAEVPLRVQVPLLRRQPIPLRRINKLEGRKISIGQPTLRLGITLLGVHLQLRGLRQVTAARVPATRKQQDQSSQSREPHTARHRKTTDFG